MADITNLKFGRVDCPNAGTVCKTIRGVPTLRLLFKGRNVEYDANRDVNTVGMLVDWIMEGIASAEAKGMVPFSSKDLPTTEYVRTFTDVDSLRAVQAAESSEFWFITYYKETCPHCRRWITTLNTLTAQLKDTPNLKFGRVNCGRTGPVCDANGVKSFPSIKMYYKGSKAPYDDFRDNVTVTKWLTDVMADDGKLVKNPPPPPPPPQLPLSENVVQLNDSNFAAAEKAVDDFWFVVFYRTNCPHCRAFIPTENTVADKLNATHPRLKFGRINCLDTEAGGAALCTAQKVKKVPTIRLYYKGSKIESVGGRDVESLTKWISENLENDGDKIKNAPPIVSEPEPTKAPPAADPFMLFSQNDL